MQFQLSVNLGITAGRSMSGHRNTDLQRDSNEALMHVWVVESGSKLYLKALFVTLTDARPRITQPAISDSAL